MIKFWSAMNFGGDFVKNTQKKTSEARLRAAKKYSNSKWRPAIYIDKDMQSDIENRITKLGYRSFNEYVIALINQDMKKDI